MSRVLFRNICIHTNKKPQHLTFQLVKNQHQLSPMSNISLTNEQVRTKRSKMFEEERKRQINSIPRLEKIEVHYVGTQAGENIEETLILNRNISTPFTVAQHLSEVEKDRAALALVNGHIWDMTRPLEEDCTVELLHFHIEDPFHVNRAFWRSCSFLLGAAIESAFREDIFVQLHSFPPPLVTSGSFVIDVDLNMGHTWDPTREEMMVFSAQMHRLAEKKLPIERLSVDQSLALKMFEDNKFKVGQIPSIAAKSESGKLTVYKVGDHVDISSGPMVGDSSFIGRRCTVPVAHKIYKDNSPMYRFQGVALPKDIYLNHYAFGILEKRASHLNKFGLDDTRVPFPV